MLDFLNRYVKSRIAFVLNCYATTDLADSKRSVRPKLFPKKLLDCMT